MDHYGILRVSRTATFAEIKKAYRQLAIKLHPDITGNDESKTQEFKRVNEAYGILSSKDQRIEYDASLRAEAAAEGGRSSHATFYGQAHPYANKPPGTGIDEQVWYAHHYGQPSRGWMPPRNYGEYIVENMYEQEIKRVEEERSRKKIKESVAATRRRAAKLRQKHREQADTDNHKNDCVIS